MFFSDAYEKAFDVVTDLDRTNCGKQGCHKDADCGCNLIKGNYRCICRRGYYGTGDKNGQCTRKKLICYLMNTF